MSIITLTTDLGTKDSYLASVKGSIYSQLEDAKIVDISNDIITLSNHNFQTGQKLLYASVISDASPAGAANTSVDNAFAYSINKRFDDTIWASFDMTIFTFDSN